MAEEPAPNRPAKTKVAAESAKHDTTGGGHLLGNQVRNSKGQDLGIVEEEIAGVSGIKGLALPSAAGSVRKIGVFFLSDLSQYYGF